MLLELMKRDKDYTGIGGYLNHENRSVHTDRALLCAIEHNHLSYADAFLWVNSRCARHTMDSWEPGDGTTFFIHALAADLCVLRSEQMPKHSNEYESIDSSGELRTHNTPKREV